LQRLVRFSVVIKNQKKTRDSINPLMGVYYFK
jgi:hypothetical protein